MMCLSALLRPPLEPRAHAHRLRAPRIEAAAKAAQHSAAMAAQEAAKTTAQEAAAKAAQEAAAMAAAWAGCGIAARTMILDMAEAGVQVKGHGC